NAARSWGTATSSDRSGGLPGRAADARERPLPADSGMEAKKYFPELPCRIRRHRAARQGQAQCDRRSLDTETEMSKTEISKQISSNKQTSHGLRRSSVCIIGRALCLGLARGGPRARGTADRRAACPLDAFRLCGAETPNVERIIAA